MKYATRLLLSILFFSILSFSIIIYWVNKAIDHYSFVTIEKQLMEKADMCELSFREILTRYDKAGNEPDSSQVAKAVLQVLKASGREVRIYDSNQKLLGLAENGTPVYNGSPKIFEENISKSLKGNYSYTVTDQGLIYFAIPIQNKYYENAYVFEIVEDISYFYEIMEKIRSILIFGAVGFIILMTGSSVFIARRTTKPIKYLLGATEKFSRQQFDQVSLNRKDELGNLAEGLNQMGMKLNDYIQYQKQFVSNVSHELKTPLAAIRGFSQYLYEGEQEDVSQLTLQVIEDMKSKAVKKDVLIKWKLDRVIYVNGNKTLITHAIANVVDNAIKYSNAGGQVTAETYISDNKAVIKISDQGIGIHQHEIALVQERFYRAGNSNLANGSGLGLSLCKEIVEKFNGQLMIESEIGVGTSVSIVLPLA